MIMKSHGHVHKLWKHSYFVEYGGTLTHSDLVHAVTDFVSPPISV